ncbi:MAG: hypothetical protein AAGA03_19705, partial [Planctomycetota bacterium]
MSDTAQKLAVLLPELPIDDAADHWLRAVALQPNAESIAYLRRKVIAQMTQRIVAATGESSRLDRGKLAAAAAVANVIRDPLQPLPQAGHVLRLTARDLSRSPLTPDHARLVARRLALALRADRVGDVHAWCSPGLIRWIQPLIEKADENRRLAGDLIVGESDARSRAETYLAQAEAAYQDVDRFARLVHEAIRVHASGPSDLRRLSSLIANRTELGVDAFGNDDVDQIEQLYQLMDDVARHVAVALANSVTDRESKLKQLDRVLGQYQEKQQRLSLRLNDWQLETLTTVPQSLSPALAALSQAGGTLAIRKQAWDRICRLSASESAGAEVSAGISERLASSQKAAAVRGRLMLGKWSDRDFADLGAQESATRPQIRHLLEVFASDPTWWSSLQKAEQALEQLEEAAAERAGKAASQETMPIAARGSFNWILSRMASTPPLICRDSFLTIRRSELVRYLAFQINRFGQDGYWSVDHESTPYHTRVAELLHSDIVALSPADTPPEPTVASSQDSIQLVAPETLVWTSQIDQTAEACVQTSHDNQKGFVALWVDSVGDIEVTQPVTHQRVCRPLLKHEERASA